MLASWQHTIETALDFSSIPEIMLLFPYLMTMLIHMEPSTQCYLAVMLMNLLCISVLGFDLNTGKLKVFQDSKKDTTATSKHWLFSYGPYVMEKIAQTETSLTLFLNFWPGLNTMWTTLIERAGRIAQDGCTIASKYSSSPIPPQHPPVNPNISMPR